MLAKFFYPDELTVVIDHLKEEGDLNEAALKTLGAVVNCVHFPFALWGIVLMIAGIINPSFGERMDFNVLVFTLLILFAAWLYVRGVWRAYMASYIFGDLETCTVLSVKTISLGYIRIKVETDISKEIRFVHAINPMSFSLPEYMPVIGDKISIFVSQNASYRAVPAIEGYMQKTCLKKSLIKQHESEPETTVSGQ